MKTGISVLVTIAATLLVLGFTPTTLPSAHASSQAFNLTGSRTAGWNSTNPGPTIHLTQGYSVTANLHSGDGYPHTFVIDTIGTGITSSPNCGVDKCSNSFTTTANFPFTVDLAPGTYTYFCSIHLGAMRGTVVVQSSSNTAPDFAASSNPSTLTIASGSTGSTTITITSLNGFSGTISLTATVSPSGPQVSLSSGTLTLSPNSPVSTTLTVSTTTGIYSTPVANGAYTIKVTGSNGSLSHSAPVTLNVGSASSSSGSSSTSYSSGLPATVLLGGTAAVLAVIAVTVVVVAARRRMRA